MSTVRLRCHCGSTFSLDGPTGGQVYRCQNCGQPLELPPEVSDAGDAGGETESDCTYCAKFAGVAARCGVCGRTVPDRKPRRRRRTTTARRSSLSASQEAAAPPIAPGPAPGPAVGPPIAPPAPAGAPYQAPPIQQQAPPAPAPAAYGAPAPGQQPYPAPAAGYHAPGQPTPQGYGAPAPAYGAPPAIAPAPAAPPVSGFMALQLSADEDGPPQAPPAPAPVDPAAAAPRMVGGPTSMPEPRLIGGPTAPEPRLIGGPTAQAPRLVSGPTTAQAPRLISGPTTAVDDDEDDVIENVEVADDDDDDEVIENVVVADDDEAPAGGGKLALAGDIELELADDGELTASGERQLMRSGALVDSNETMSSGVRKPGSSSARHRRASSGEMRRRRSTGSHRAAADTGTSGRRRRGSSSARQVTLFTCPNCEAETPRDLMECDGCGLPIPRGGGGGGRGSLEENIPKIGAYVGIACVVLLVAFVGYKQLSKETVPDDQPKTTRRNGPRIGERRPPDPDDPDPPGGGNGGRPTIIDPDETGGTGSSGTGHGLKIPNKRIYDPVRHLARAIHEDKPADIEAAIAEIKSAGANTIDGMRGSIFKGAKNADMREGLAHAIYHAYAGNPTSQVNWINDILEDGTPAVAAFAAETAWDNHPELQGKIRSGALRKGGAAFGRMWVLAVREGTLPDPSESHVFTRAGARSGRAREPVVAYIAGNGDRMPDVVELLKSKRAETRALAFQLLNARTGESFDYDPKNDEAANKTAIRKWRDFAKALVRLRNDLASLAKDHHTLTDVRSGAKYDEETVAIHRKWLETKRTLIKKGRDLVVPLLAVLREGQPEGLPSSTGFRTAEYFAEALDVLAYCATSEDLPAVQASFTANPTGAGAARRQWPQTIGRIGGLDALPFLIDTAIADSTLLPPRLLPSAVGDIHGDLSSAAASEPIGRLADAMPNMLGNDWTGAVTVLLMAGHAEGIEEAFRAPRGSYPKLRDEDVALLVASYQGKDLYAHLVECVSDPDAPRGVLESIGGQQLAMITATHTTGSDAKEVQKAFEGETEWKRYASAVGEVVVRSGRRRDASWLWKQFDDASTGHRLTYGRAIALAAGKTEGKNLYEHFLDPEGPTAASYRGTPDRAAEVVALSGHRDALRYAYEKLVPVVERIRKTQQTNAAAMNQIKAPKAMVEIIGANAKPGSKEAELLVELLRIGYTGASVFKNVIRLVDKDSASLLFSYLYPTVPACLSAAIGVAGSKHPDAVAKIKSILHVEDGYSKKRTRGSLVIAMALADEEKSADAARDLIEKHRDKLIPEDYGDLAYALALSRTKPNQELIRELLHHPRPDVRIGALRGLALHPDRVDEAVERGVASLLLDPSPEVRFEAAITCLRLEVDGEGPVDPKLVGARLADGDFLLVREDVYHRAFQTPEEGRTAREAFADAVRTSVPGSIEVVGGPSRLGKDKPNLAHARAMGRSIKRQVLDAAPPPGG